MNQGQLRKECSRLFRCETIADCQDLLNIYVEFFFQTVYRDHKYNADLRSDVDAKMVMQMMMTKALHLRNTISGITYVSNDGKRLNKIIDPTVVASLIRNIYETTGMFNLIYRNTKSKDEKEIIYLLWVHSGLAYRQRFDNIITEEENLKKAEHEKLQMVKIVTDIENTELYKKLDEKNQQKIKTRLRQKEYLMRFEANNVKFLNWRELANVMDIKNGKLDHTYSYFSLYSHPSNVSVFQFADMFQKGKESFPSLVTFNLQISFFMFSIFVADYINLFPDVKKTYDSMGIVEQIVINFHNKMARGEEYSFNDKWKLLG